MLMDLSYILGCVNNWLGSQIFLFVVIFSGGIFNKINTTIAVSIYISIYIENLN